MRRPIWTVNKDVIEENENELPQVSLENGIHETLKRCRSICEAEWHNDELIESFMSAKSRLVSIRWVHADLVVPCPEVQFREEDSVVQLIEQLFDQWNGEFVFDGYVVKLPIVNAKPPRSVLLVNQYDGCCKWALAWPNDPRAKHLLYLAFYFVLVHRTITVRATADGLVRLEGYVMIEVAFWRQRRRFVEDVGKGV